MKCLLFYLIFCYEMKCPGIRKINLPLFFSYVHYSCHTSQLKYTGTIWTTLYRHCLTIKMPLTRQTQQKRKWSVGGAVQLHLLRRPYFSTIPTYNSYLNSHFLLNKSGNSSKKNYHFYLIENGNLSGNYKWDCR